MAREFDFEPVRGLPEALPEGEHILWQGEPTWAGLATRVFHVRAVAAYFALAALAFAFGAAVSTGPGAAVMAIVSMAPVAVLAVAILAGLAYVNARSAVYTITNRRVVMRIGAALTKAINIPFGLIAAADLKVGGDGRGDLALRLVEGARLPYLNLWPHVRPFASGPAQPAFRGIANPQAAGDVLSDALRAHLALHPAQAHEPTPSSAPIAASGAAPQQVRPIRSRGPGVAAAT